MRVTINDIAKASGFSKTSVSFAFNDPGRISKVTREKILSIAESLGYVPDPVARNLSLRKIGTIGLLLPQPINRVFLNPYMNQILLGIGESCQKQDYSLTLVPPLRGRIFDGARSAAVDGFIAMGLHSQMKVVQLIQQRHIPFVTIDGTHSEQVAGVNSRNEDAAYRIMKSVLEAGHRRIVILALEHPSGQDDDRFTGVRDWRLAGFTRALVEAGLSIDDMRVIDGEPSLQGGRSAVASVYSQSPGKAPTAYVSMSDISAIGAMQELQNRGLSVPEDVSVTGFDNIPESELVRPRLTTISQPAFEMGYTAANMLFAILENNIVEKHSIFESELIVRDSLGNA